MPDNNKTDKIDPESIKNISKLSPQDKAILALVKEHPTSSMYEIGKLLQEQGNIKNVKSIYSNLTYSEYLRTEIDKVHTHNHETLARQAVPRANKTLISIVKDRDIPKLDKLPAINTILKHGMKQDIPDKTVQHITIEQMNVLQQQGRDDCKVIEGEVVDNIGDKDA